MSDREAYLKRNKLKTAFKVKKAFNPIYTGGAVALSTEGLLLFTTLDDVVVVSNTQTGEEVGRLLGDSSISSFALTPRKSDESGILCIARRSLGLCFHTTPVTEDSEAFKIIPRAHNAPIITMSADPTGTLIATGSSDGIIKVWDAARAHCTHVFKGHGGVISAFAWHIPSRNEENISPRLVSAADDTRIRVWNLSSRQCEAVLEGHTSVVRGLAVTDDGQKLFSAGRDQTLRIWTMSDLETSSKSKKASKQSRLLDTVQLGETIEACGLVTYPQLRGKGKARAQSQTVIYTGGDSGLVRLWDMQGNLLNTQPGNGKSPELYSVISLPAPDAASASAIISISIDQNIITLAVPSLLPTKHVVGFNDEIIDTVFLSAVGTSAETVLAAATNSEHIRIYDLSPEGFSNTTLLTGHDEVVLCLARDPSGRLLMSGGKDKTARLWMCSVAADGSQQWQCVGICTGHLNSVGAVVLSKIEGERNSDSDFGFAVTASQDHTIKMWDLSEISAPSSSEIPSVKSLLTLKAHDKDINALDIAPNNRLLATGSQDKTAKLFALDVSKQAAGEVSVRLLGTLQGHKRGVWSVKFSPNDQVVATASGDKSIKLWNVNDFSCLKTFEGHTNTVLRVVFITKGMQLVSCASDGLVKVWNIKDEETVATLDNHEEKIWALAISKDETRIVSGAADSVISIWEDVTQIEEDQRAAEEEELVHKNQDYNNYVNAKDYKSAILLALAMDQPRRLLGLFTAVAQRAALDKQSITGSASVDLALTQLPLEQIYSLLLHIRDWNTSVRTSDVAQRVLHVVLKHFTLDELLQLGAGKRERPQDMAIEDRVFTDIKTGPFKRRKVSPLVGELLEGLIPYTDRHYARADRAYSQESFVLDYTLRQMDVVSEDLDMSASNANASTVHMNGNTT